jgi:hypothetical protein
MARPFADPVSRFDPRCWKADRGRKLIGDASSTVSAVLSALPVAARDAARLPPAPFSRGFIPLGDQLEHVGFGLVLRTYDCSSSVIKSNWSSFALPRQVAARRSSIRALFGPSARELGRQIVETARHEVGRGARKRAMHARAEGECIRMHLILAAHPNNDCFGWRSTRSGGLQETGLAATKFLNAVYAGVFVTPSPRIRP